MELTLARQHSWGFGFDGECMQGTNSTADLLVPFGPLDYGVGRSVKSFAVGQFLTCAILMANTTLGLSQAAKCHGRNDHGQSGAFPANAPTFVGRAFLGDSLPAIAFGGGRIPLSVSAGITRGVACFVLFDGTTSTLLCIGDSSAGALGAYAYDIGAGSQPTDVTTTVPAQFYDAVDVAGNTNNLQLWGWNLPSTTLTLPLYTTLVFTVSTANGQAGETAHDVVWNSGGGTLFPCVVSGGQTLLAATTQGAVTFHFTSSGTYIFVSDVSVGLGSDCSSYGMQLIVTVTSSPAPVRNVTTVVTSGDDTYVLLSTGQLLGAGINKYGELAQFPTAANAGFFPPPLSFSPLWISTMAAGTDFLCFTTATSHNLFW